MILGRDETRKRRRAKHSASITRTIPVNSLVDFPLDTELYRRNISPAVIVTIVCQVNLKSPTNGAQKVAKKERKKHRGWSRTLEISSC